MQSLWAAPCRNTSRKEEEDEPQKYHKAAQPRIARYPDLLLLNSGEIVHFRQQSFVIRGFLWKFLHLAHYDFTPRSHGRIHLRVFGFWDKGKEFKDNYFLVWPFTTRSTHFWPQCYCSRGHHLKSHIWNDKKRGGASPEAPEARLTIGSMLVHVFLQLWIEALY